MVIIQLLVAETNKYCNQYLGAPDSDSRCLWLPDMTVQKLCVFLALIIQMGHNEWNTLKDYGALIKFVGHFILTSWNMIRFVVYWDFYIFVTIWSKQSRLTRTMTSWKIRSLWYSQWHVGLC
jgi:hypothetical protein